MLFANITIPLARLWLYRDLTEHPAAQYVAWVSLPVCLVLFSAGFVQLVAPQAIGTFKKKLTTIFNGFLRLL